MTRTLVTETSQLMQSKGFREYEAGSADIKQG
jgi:hypothetical protein